jgi:hypothetical protein
MKMWNNWRTAIKLILQKHNNGSSYLLTDSGFGACFFDSLPSVHLILFTSFSVCILSGRCSLFMICKFQNVLTIFICKVVLIFLIILLFVVFSKGCIFFFYLLWSYWLVLDIEDEVFSQFVG